MSRIHWVLVGSLALSGAALGCSKDKEPATPAQGAVGAEQGSGTFRFAPKDQQFTQTTVETKTVSSPGSTFTSEVKGEYTWDIVAKREGDAANYSAELRRVVLRINGQNAVNEAPPDNEVNVQVDRNGQVTGVTGADSLAQGLIGRLPADERQNAQALLADVAHTAIAERFQLTVGDLQGRPTALGSTWTVPAQAGGPVRSKTWKVQGVEVCGSEQCVRVNATYDIDSQAISQQLQGDLVGSSVSASGQAEPVTLSDVTVTAQDSILVEPSTLFLHQARFEQTARVILEQSGRRQPMLISEVRDLRTQPR